MLALVGMAGFHAEKRDGIQYAGKDHVTRERSSRRFLLVFFLSWDAMAVSDWKDVDDVQ